MLTKKLGRGLQSLMPGEALPPDPEHTLVHELPIDSLIPNPAQPRRSFDDEKLEELAQSISIHGIIQPLIVRPSAQDGLYDIIAGERRWRAAKMAGLEAVPALVRESVDSRKNLELSLIENIQREDLNPIEKAKAYLSLLEDFALTQEEVATRVGQKRATVANMVRLLDLPQDIQDSVAACVLSMGHARALLALPDRDMQRSLAERIIKEDLSVRDVERAVQELLSRAPEPTAPPQPQPKPPHIVELEERIMQKLGCKSHIHTIANNRGRLIVEFADNNDFERILECLGIHLEM